MTANDGQGRVRGALSPLVAFAVLMALVVAGAAYVLSRETEPAAGPATLSEASPSISDHKLTDAEAIARFEELDAIRQRAYASPDPSLVSRVFAEERRTHQIVLRELRRLEADAVRSESTFDTRSVRVLVNRSQRITLRQVVVIDPRFVDSDGRNVTGHAPAERQTIEWTLVRVGDQWLIGDSRVVKAEAL